MWMAYVVKIVAYFRSRPLRQMLADPLASQDEVLRMLLREAAHTRFGKDHGFSKISSYDEFRRAVPLCTYEDLVPYIQRIKEGEQDVLWKGRPVFWGKTSGTTSRTKYIPVTRESLKCQLEGAQYVVINHVLGKTDISFLLGKMLIFSDGHFFSDEAGIPAAPISTIAHSRVNWPHSHFCLPPRRVNAIPDYAQRIQAMIDCTVGSDIRTVVAMPVWLLVYLRALEKSTGKTFRQHFPKFQLLILSGMDYAPYLPEIERYMGAGFTILESFPSTEGFIAFQDNPKLRGLQFALNQGIFFEFVPVNEVFNPNPRRFSIREVELGVNYALVLNTNAGLWGYVNGDTVRFITFNPHRIEITGRISHYISAFGEHVTAEEVEKSLAETAAETGATIVEFTVAPCVHPEAGLPHHAWFIEFGTQPPNIADFSVRLEQKILERNFSYKDLYVHKAIEPLQIKIVPPGGFHGYMVHLGRTGLQQKVPHASNNDQFVQGLISFLHTWHTP
jgi:hypothetical protein